VLFVFSNVRGTPLAPKETYVAVWLFSEKSDGTVDVTYTVRGAEPKRVGTSPGVLLPDALAWAADTAEVFDVIAVGGLAFVRAVAPAPVLGRVLAM
jgi:hypothetical protein